MYSKKYNVDSALIYSVIKAESNFDKNSVSKKGAIGLMQIMPSTAIFIAQQLNLENFDIKDLYLPQTNIEFGTYYLSYLYSKFNSLNAVVCSYNAGETVVKKWLNDKNYSTDLQSLKTVPYAETSKYLKKVTFFYKIYQFLI